MPLFYFNLKNGLRTTLDREGTELADIPAARMHAAAMARDIMRNDTYRALSCRLTVQDCDRNQCFELLFATVSERLEPLSSATRKAIEARADSIAGLHDDIRAVRHSLHQVRATLARADGRPHLAALNGKRLDS